MIYDFHIHTTYSDGHFTPEEVVQMAKENKVDIMCLTDHDTLLSMDKADELDQVNDDIIIYGGVEISSDINSINRHAHILAYRCDRNNNALNKLINKTKDNRTESFYKSIDIINKRGDVHINLNEIDKYKGANGFFARHIIKYLVDIGYDDGSYTKARKMLNPINGYAFTDFEYPECTDVIETIRNAGGIPIVAHTFVHDNFHGIDKMLEAGLMGIEVYHPRHTKQQQKLLMDFCDSRDLLVTCGSDFHRFFDEQHADIGHTSVDNEKVREFVSFLKK